MLGPLGLAHSVNTACRRTVGLNVGYPLTPSVIRDQYAGIHQLTKMPGNLSRLRAATDEYAHLHVEVQCVMREVRAR